MADDWAVASEAPAQTFEDQWAPVEEHFVDPWKPVSVAPAPTLGDHPQGRGLLQALKDYPMHLLGGIVDTVKAPGNILASETPTTTEQMIEPAANIAMLAGVKPSIAGTKPFVATEAPKRVVVDTPADVMGAPSAEAPPVPEGHIRYYHGTAYPDASGFSGKTFVTPNYEYARDYHTEPGGPKNNVLYTDLPHAEADVRGLIDEVNRYPINGPIEDGASVLKPLKAADPLAPPESTVPPKPKMPDYVAFGPTQIKTTPITGKTLWHETSPESAVAIVKDDLTNNVGGGRGANVFVTDNPDIALGQAGRGVRLEFDGNLVSGVEHRKPGTGDLTGREYKANAMGNNAVTAVDVAPGEKLNLSPTWQARFDSLFERTDNPDGSVRYTRKAASEPTKPESTVPLQIKSIGAEAAKPEAASEALAHPEPTPKEMNAAQVAARTIKNILIPDEVSPLAESAAADIRSAGGRAARDTETTRSLLDDQAAKVGRLPDSEKLGLIDYIENRSKGFELPDKSLQPVADAVKQAMDLRRAKLEKLDSTETAQFVTDYYTHLWKDPKAAEALFTGPAKEGSGKNLKARSIPTVAEGIARGLEPATVNPLETTMKYVQNMDRFIATNEVIDKALKDGTVKRALPGEQPPGWVEVNSRRGAAQPLWAEPDWARVYNNFVDRGFHKDADVGRIYDGIRNTSNAITSLELGLSGFHAATMAQEAVVNGVARGISELASGRPIKAANAAAQGFMEGTLVPNVLKGREIERVYLGKSAGTPLTRQITDLLTEAGGRAKGARHAPDYQYSQAGSYWDSFKKGTVLAELRNSGADMRAHPFTGPLKFTAQTVGRVMQTVAKPLFEYAIPKIKNSAFYDNMSTWLENHPGAEHAEQVKAARKIWDSVDNRFGEVVQDNIFWKKTMKQSLQVALRSYSWTFGTIQEIGGGAAAIARHPTSIAAASKHYNPKASYVIALPIVYATLNAVYQKMKTGKDPESVEDVMRGGLTGGTQPGVGGRGTVLERVMMPGYMKDVFGWYEHPWQEAVNKTATGPRMVVESLKNKDWKDQPIRNPQDPTVEQVKQYLAYVYRSLGPISVKQYMQGNKAGSNISTGEQALGFRPAPSFLQDPEGYTKMMKGIGQRDWNKKERYDKRQEKQYKGPQ